ncbi:Holliday junction branch migration protein RuvA [Paenibacillus sp. SYP-B3998]|uniref:Holliday junction branch migration complex subunit RuvA n=1 Tax=Paenibacillus sp. SYP-B3998 TaxID=2678564 RepID=A0A6G3ZR46_9BACL|nr:Holliday junction branch migration protein RuvA [Paenibacillus sp. SYP-B3998]NEW04520.1 Holliday junction branch migration protein RuvA [Paenibacillus sp. SYP-B3998]
MIDFLRGKVALRESDYAVLDVNGVGYRVFCPNPYALSHKEDEDVTMYLHYHVREDAHLLFGFLSRDEQSLFRLLLDVTGIGPKVALGILAAGGRPEAVIMAISQENLAFLTKLPGIGKKTAQRIILDLKDKLGSVSLSSPEAAVAMSIVGSTQIGEGGTAWSEAKEALMTLGYTEAEADRAWLQVKPKAQASDSVDVLMKLALQALYTM